MGCAVLRSPTGPRCKAQRLLRGDGKHGPSTQARLLVACAPPSPKGFLGCTHLRHRPRGLHCRDEQRSHDDGADHRAGAHEIEIACAALRASKPSYFDRGASRSPAWPRCIRNCTWTAAKFAGARTFGIACCSRRWVRSKRQLQYQRRRSGHAGPAGQLVGSAPLTESLLRGPQGLGERWAGRTASTPDRRAGQAPFLLPRAG